MYETAGLQEWNPISAKLTHHLHPIAEKTDEGEWSSPVPAQLSARSTGRCTGRSDCNIPLYHVMVNPKGKHQKIYWGA